MKAHDILAKARDILFERAKDRDTEEERAMAKTVAIFAAWTGHPLTELQGWQFMTCLKMARSAQGEFRLDDVLDRIGYAALEAEHANDIQIRSVARAASGIVGTKAHNVIVDDPYSHDPTNPFAPRQDA